MLELRNYQRECLDELRAYLGRVSKLGADTAFYERTKRPYRPVAQLPGLPYVCLRVPTGGGKTLMACHALGAVATEYQQAERIVCLWLVPSNAIREQTLKALKDRAHPYRQAVDAQFMGNVRVMALADALAVTKSDLEHDTCIIVSTLAALRVEDTEGRKIYENAEALDPHFAALPAAVEAVLERNGDGLIPHSLANVLRMWRPVVIMDEAHNARTKLSFDTLERFAPSCIVEFTATPQTEHKPEKGLLASNIIAHVSAAQLKAEEMIKLPIRLHTRPDWKDILADTVQLQSDLEAVARKEEAATGEYIRPIVLLQAQPHREGQTPLTAEVVKQALLDSRVPVERIAVATGETREIAGVNLFDRACEIRFIITQQALKEGWDCSFAYIFCSVADIGSTRDVEQLLGRVLRLPGAKSKQHDELNRAYAMVSSRKSLDTLGQLGEALIENGFERLESTAFITHEQPTLPGYGPLFGPPDVAEKMPEKPDLSKLAEPLRERITFDAKSGTLTVAGGLSPADRQALEQCVTTDKGKEAVQRLADKAQGCKAAGVGAMRIPALAIRVDGQLEFFEETHFLDTRWSLADCDAALSEKEFPSDTVAGTEGEVDVSAEGRIETKFIGEVHLQLALLRSEPGWTVAELVNRIDREIIHKDVTWLQSTRFIQKAVEGLMDSRHVTVEQLARERSRLRVALAEKIDEHRRVMEKRSFDQLLFGAGADELEVSPEVCFDLSPERYAPRWYYEPGYVFQRHAFPMVGELKSEGEEFECARFIDNMPGIKRWVRNIERSEAAFWLPTSTDRFYPDFVAELTDGRWLVVEYKGEDRWSNDDSKEKRDIGAIWAARSGGACLFAMPKGKDFAAIATLAAAR